MSLVAPVEDGQIVTSTSSESLANSTSSKKDNSVVSSDTFLTMLVAEMQNQDPLEPTSNTEWVSQYATFTEVEKMDEMGDSMNLLRANGLVGQNVIMKVTSSSTGDTSYVQGIVDFVVYEEGKAYLYIDDQPYALEDLDTVATQEYTDAYALKTEFTNKIANLPTVGNITTTYQKDIQDLLDTYVNMTDYQKGFIDESYITALASYKTALEGMGVTFTKATEVKGTTMDDLLSAFNTKMDSILESIKTLSAGSSSGESDTPSVASYNEQNAAGVNDTKGTDGNVADVNGTEETDGNKGSDTDGNVEDQDGEKKDNDSSDIADKLTEGSSKADGTDQASGSSGESESTNGETQASGSSENSTDSDNESNSSNDSNDDNESNASGEAV